MSKKFKVRSSTGSNEPPEKKINNHFWFSDKLEDWLPNVQEKREIVKEIKRRGDVPVL